MPTHLGRTCLPPQRVQRQFPAQRKRNCCWQCMMCACLSTVQKCSQGRSRLDEHVFVRTQPDYERTVDFDRPEVMCFLESCAMSVKCSVAAGGLSLAPAAAACHMQNTLRALKMIDFTVCRCQHRLYVQRAAFIRRFRTLLFESGHQRPANTHAANQSSTWEIRIAKLTISLMSCFF